MELRDLTPLLVREAVVSLYPADVAGTPLRSAPVWCGAAANGLKLGLTFEEQLSFSSGDRYKTAHHTDELHTIEIERTWLIQRADPGAPTGPQRGGRYCLEIIWADGQSWYQRLYSGVTGRTADLTSDGPRQLNQPQTFRAETFVASGGTAAGGIFTPITTVPGATGAEQLVGFFGEAPLVPDEYLLGHYRWDGARVITNARWACWAPQAETVLALEVAGGLTGDTLTLPAGVANTDHSGEVALHRTVPAGATVRWRVASGPEIEGAAWHVAVICTGSALSA